MSRYDFKDIDIVFNANEENLDVHYMLISLDTAITADEINH